MLSLAVLSFAFATTQAATEQKEAQQSNDEVVVVALTAPEDVARAAAALKKSGMTNEEVLQKIQAATEAPSKENSVKAFVKKYKKELMAGAAVVTVGGVVYLVWSGKAQRMYTYAKDKTVAGYTCAKNKVFGASAN